MSTYFKGTTTKNPVEYRCGEMIEFDLQLMMDEIKIGCPMIKWETWGDDGRSASGFTPGESGHIKVYGTLEKPGFLRVIVRACSINGAPLMGFDTYEGGAGAEIDKIRQGVDDPEDFDEFWAGEIETVKYFTPEIIEKVQVESANPDFDLYDVKISAPTKRPVSGYLSVPKNKPISECGAFLGFMGYGVASAPATYRAGEISLHINSHGIENGKDAAFYEELRKGELAAFGFKDDENASPETCYFRDMIRRGMIALKWLAESSGYSGEPIQLTGGSMGAMQATNIAARAEALGIKIRQLWIGVPWLCDLGGITIGRQRGWRPNFTKGIRYFDTAAAAARVSADTPVVIECGLGDYVCPPSGEVVLWHNFRGQKSITFLQNKTHGYNPPERDATTIV
ncbi:MAG: acetylxylan esterase [Ruminococcaceae bacterium]|nr:acetylxylan esterase [Oscillospiraceae bacterium]